MTKPIITNVGQRQRLYRFRNRFRTFILTFSPGDRPREQHVVTVRSRNGGYWEGPVISTDGNGISTARIRCLVAPIEGNFDQDAGKVISDDQGEVTVTDTGDDGETSEPEPNVPIVIEP